MDERNNRKIIPAPCTEKETEVGMKVVAIMQAVTEDFDDSSKRMWRKMLGIDKDLQDSKQT